MTQKRAAFIGMIWSGEDPDEPLHDPAYIERVILRYFELEQTLLERKRTNRTGVTIASSGLFFATK